MKNNSVVLNGSVRRCQIKGTYHPMDNPITNKYACCEDWENAHSVAVRFRPTRQKNTPVTAL